MSVGETSSFDSIIVGGWFEAGSLVVCLDTPLIVATWELQYNESHDLWIECTKSVQLPH